MPAPMKPGSPVGERTSKQSHFVTNKVMTAVGNEAKRDRDTEDLSAECQSRDSFFEKKKNS